MRARHLIDEARRELRSRPERFSALPEGRYEAELILANLLGREPEPAEEIPAVACRRFRALVARRADGEPLPYVLGWAEFRRLRLTIRPGAFVPRATSEFLAEQAIRRLRRRRAPVAVDLATGIGPVALAVADEVRAADVHGTDVSGSAIRQARENARSLRLRNASFHRGSLFDPLPRRLEGRVDVITVHPPYVARGEVRTLPAEVRDFEPIESLTDRSRDGMGLLRPVVSGARRWLRPGGWLLVEVAHDRARPVRSLLIRAGLTEVRSTRGPMPYTRVLTGRTGH